MNNGRDIDPLWLRPAEVAKFRLLFGLIITLSACGPTTIAPRVSVSQHDSDQSPDGENERTGDKGDDQEEDAKSDGPTSKKKKKAVDPGLGDDDEQESSKDNSVEADESEDNMDNEAEVVANEILEEFAINFPVLRYHAYWTEPKSDGGVYNYTSDSVVTTTDAAVELKYDGIRSSTSANSTSTSKRNGRTTYTRATNADLAGNIYRHGLIFAKAANHKSDDGDSMTEYTVGAPYPLFPFPGARSRYAELLAGDQPHWETTFTYIARIRQGDQVVDTPRTIGLRMTVSAAEGQNGLIMIRIASEVLQGAEYIDDFARANVARLVEFTIDTDKRLLLKADFERFDDGKETHLLCERLQNGVSEPFACGQ